MTQQSFPSCEDIPLVPATDRSSEILALRGCHANPTHTQQQLWICSREVGGGGLCPQPRRSLRHVGVEAGMHNWMMAGSWSSPGRSVLYRHRFLLHRHTDGEDQARPPAPPRGPEAVAALRGAWQSRVRRSASWPHAPPHLRRDLPLISPSPPYCQPLAFPAPAPHHPSPVSPAKQQKGGPPWLFPRPPKKPPSHSQTQVRKSPSSPSQTPRGHPSLQQLEPVAPLMPCACIKPSLTSSTQVFFCCCSLSPLACSLPNACDFSASAAPSSTCGRRRAVCPH